MQGGKSRERECYNRRERRLGMYTALVWLTYMRENVERECHRGDKKIYESKPTSLQETSRSSSLAARLGPSSQTKVAQDEDLDASVNTISGNNVVKLHQPIRKSRFHIFRYFYRKNSKVPCTVAHPQML